MDAPRVVFDSQREAEFDRAFEWFDRLVDWDEVDDHCPVRSNAVYRSSVVLWMLVYQRLKPDKSLEATVKVLLETWPDLLPNNKRVTNKTLSHNTGGYARARKRLSTKTTRWFAEQITQSLVKATPPFFKNRRVYLVDGTTITLAPEPVLRREFPPASNQHGTSPFPVALLAMAHELSSGAALVPEVGAMYGENAVSETALVDRLFTQMPEDAIVLADAGFGIFAVACSARRAHRDFVMRLTQSRFKALRRQATRVSRQAQGVTTYELTWRPSLKERRSHPDLPADAVLPVHLHEIRLHDSLTLYLVTSLSDSAEELADLYHRRGDVEIDIRNFKVVLSAETIRARSVEMFHKELHLSLVSYNLVTQFRRQAADQAQLPPRRLSFKRVWTTFRTFLLSAMYTDPDRWRTKYQQALRYAMQDKLPNRPNRSYEREAYSKRPKSAQFKKRSPANDTQTRNL